MARRCRIDDDARVRSRALAEQVGESEQREDLVAAGKCRVDETLDIGPIEIRAAIDDLGDDVAPAREEVVAKAWCVELAGVEVGLSSDRGRLGSDRRGENCRERIDSMKRSTSSAR